MNFLLRTGSHYTWGEEILLHFQHEKGAPRISFTSLYTSYQLVFLNEEGESLKFLRTFALTPRYSPAEEKRPRERVLKDRRYVGKIELVTLGHPALEDEVCQQELHHALSELAGHYPCYRGLLDLSKWKAVLLNQHPDWKYTWPHDTVAEQYRRYQSKLLEEMKNREKR
jgi:hypothetical protein